jgi:hypothetical protein
MRFQHDIWACSQTNDDQETGLEVLEQLGRPAPRIPIKSASEQIFPANNPMGLVRGSTSWFVLPENCKFTSPVSPFYQALFQQHHSILSVGHAHVGPRRSRGTFNFDSCAPIAWIWRKPDGVPLRVGVATLPRPIFFLKIYGEAATWLWQPGGI